MQTVLPFLSLFWAQTAFSKDNKNIMLLGGTGKYIFYFDLLINTYNSCEQSFNIHFRRKK